MNLRQLEAFRATMRTGSITGASKYLHISQPSISRLISNLEESVGFKLFVRVGRGLVSTVEAKRFYDGVEGMFVGIDRLTELANTIRTTSGGAVAVGVIPSLSTTVVPGAVSEFHNANPDVSIMLYARNTPAIIDSVQMLQLDIGIVGRQPPYEGVETLFQTILPYVCLVPESHSLSKSDDALDLESLVDRETLITSGGEFPDEMLEMDPELSMKLRRKSRLSAANMPIAAALAKATGALAIVDPFSANVAVTAGGVVIRPLVQRLIYHIAVVSKSRGRLSMEAELLSDVITQRIRQFEEKWDTPR